MVGSLEGTHDLERSARTLLDLTAEAMIVLDARALIVFSNRAFREACGVEPEGLPLLALVDGTARAQLEPTLLRFLDGREASISLQLQLAKTTHALELRIERRAEQPDLLYGLARVVTHHDKADVGSTWLEQKLRALHDTERFLIVVSELDTSRLLDVNRGFERIYHVSAQDVLGKTAVELGILSPEQQALLSANLHAVGTTDLDSLELHTPDGRTIKLLTHATKLDCEPPLVLSIAADVTDYIAAEARARETDQRFAALFENLNDAMYFVDDKGRVFDANAAACKQLGYTREELLQLSIEDFVASPGFNMQRAIADFTGKSLTRYESQHRNKQGEVHPVEITLCQIPYGGTMATAAMARDLTAQRRYEAKILEANSRMQAILQTLPDLLFEIDESGVICDFHSYRTDLLTLPVEHFLGKKLPDLTPKEISDAIMGAVHEAIDKGLSSVVQYPVRNNERWYEMSAARCVVPAGQRPRAVALARDITERKKHEQELTRSNEELSRFTYTVSHDLKSPLVTIRSFAGMLRKDLAKGDAERVERDLGFIEKAATRMHELLDDLLTLSRVGRQSSPPVRLSLQELAREACELVAGQIAQNGAHVEITSTPLWFVGERTRLLEVFQNLIDNAIKFAKPGEPAHVHIGVERMRDEPQPVVCVRDRGIGIDPRFKHKLFGLFEKLQPEASGTGIGLALIKRIIELHGGRVWIESEGVGLGTTVSFTLPSMTLEDA